MRQNKQTHRIDQIDQYRFHSLFLPEFTFISHFGSLSLSRLLAAFDAQGKIERHELDNNCCYSYYYYYCIVIIQ